LVPLTIIVVLIRLSRSTPSWWIPADPLLPATVAQAEVVENSFLGQVSLVRPPTIPPQSPDTWVSEDWKVSLKQSDANAWLAARLPRWLSNRLHSSDASLVPPVQVQFLEGRMSLAVELAHSGRRQVVAVAFTPHIDVAGALWARDLSLSAGRVTIPADWSQSLVDFRSSSLAQSIRDPDFIPRLTAILNETEPLLADPSLPLDDGRRVRLLELTPLPHRLVVRCRTEGAASP
jgi:hypothetical protein